jgi:hypothetical protein
VEHCQPAQGWSFLCCGNDSNEERKKEQVDMCGDDGGLDVCGG